MPTRDQTISDAIRIFSNAHYPNGLSLDNAWMGIYQTLLWFEPIHHLGFEYLPHIIDADKLRPSSPSRSEGWKRPKAWQKRADAIRHYLSEQLELDVSIIHNHFDGLMREPDYRGMQRQNTLGIAFSGLIRHIFKQFGNTALTFELEQDAARIFAGIAFPGRSSAPRIDILGLRNDMPGLVISAKWSVRHDRLNDITNECPVYKAAYERIYRSRERAHLRYYVVTNEFDPSRLNKMLDDTCIDGVIHAHKNGVANVCRLDGRLDRLIDLTTFVNSLIENKSP